MIWMADPWLYFLVSSLVAFAGGYIFGVKLKMPAGRLTGAMIFVALFEIFTGLVWYPEVLFFMVKVGAGVFIGVRFKKSDFFQLRTILLPFLIMIGIMLAFNIASGLLIARFTNISLMTALLSTAPGGVTEMTMIAIDLGEDSTIVSSLHIIRVVVVICLFPQCTKYFSRFYHKKHSPKNPEAQDCHLPEADPPPVRPSKNIDILLTVLVAGVGGLLGQLSQIAGGVIIGSILFTVIFNLATKRAFVPLKQRWIVQTFAGLTIGARFTMESVSHLGSLGLAVGIMLAGYLAMWCLLIVVLMRISKLDIETTMLATCPAGVTDMALIAIDMGGNSGQVAELQVLRLVFVIAFFPQLYQSVSS